MFFRRAYKKCLQNQIISINFTTFLKMKKQNFIMVFALVAFGFMACDNESVQLNTNEPETEINLSYEAILNGVASSLGVDVIFESVEVFYGLCPEFTVPGFEFDRLLTRNLAVRESWDIDNSTTMRLATGSGDSFTAITTPHKDNPNTVSHVMISSTGEAFGFVADTRFDEISGMMNIVLDDELEPIDTGDGFRRGGCGWKGAIAFGSAVVTIASVPTSGGILTGAGVVLTAAAYADWLGCMLDKVPFTMVDDRFVIQYAVVGDQFVMRHELRK